MKINNKAGGALLFTIITAFVLSLLASSFVYLSSSQYQLTETETNRIQAIYLAKAGMQYAIWWARNNPDTLAGLAVGANYTLPPDDFPGGLGGTSIIITRINPTSPAPFKDLSNFGIKVNVDY